MKKNKIIFIIVIAVLILLGGIFSYFEYKSLKTVDTVIELDVNPSIELKINKDEDVLKVVAINKDGNKVLKGLKVDNEDLDDAIELIIKAMYKKGYISDLNNSILISVQNENQQRNIRIQKEIASEINDVLEDYSLDIAVITQNYKNNNALEKKAIKNNISLGNAEFIERILDNDLTNIKGEKYTFEQLAKLNINELSAILDSRNKSVKNIRITGKTSTKKYISLSKAKDIVFKDANISSSSAKKIVIQLDYENDKMVYEIDFVDNTKEYEYEINAITGIIIDKSIERKDMDDEISEKSNNTNLDDSKKKSNNYIGISKAKYIALNDANVPLDNAKDLEVELDYENGTAVYDVEFNVNEGEFHYEINALTGNIITKAIEKDD